MGAALLVMPVADRAQHRVAQRRQFDGPEGSRSTSTRSTSSRSRSAGRRRVQRGDERRSVRCRYSCVAHTLTAGRRRYSRPIVDRSFVPIHAVGVRISAHIDKEQVRRAVALILSRGRTRHSLDGIVRVDRRRARRPSDRFIALKDDIGERDVEFEQRTRRVIDALHALRVARAIGAHGSAGLRCLGSI